MTDPAALSGAVSGEKALTQTVLYQAHLRDLERELRGLHRRLDTLGDAAGPNDPTTANALWSAAASVEEARQTVRDLAASIAKDGES